MKTRIFKALSILLAVMVVFSACACVLSTVVATTPDITYYVSEDATSTKNGSKDNPFATIYEAVDKAVKDGELGDGDTLNVVVSGEVLWSADPSSDNFPKHSFKLFITSENGATIRALSGRNIVLNGPTEFGKVTIDPYDWKDLRFNDQDVTFSADTKFSWLGGLTLGVNTPTHDAVQNVVFNSAGKDIFLSNSSANKTYDKPINITYNYAPGSSNFNFCSNDPNKQYTTTYNNLINFNIKAATSITFPKIDDGLYSFGENGAVQIINSSATEFTADKDELADILAEEKLIVINNKSGNANLVEFAGEKGKFKINADDLSSVVLTDENETVITVTSNVISLGAGVYKISIDRKPIAKEYFVSPDGEKVEAGKGSDGLGTEDKPVRSFADVTRLIANDGLTEIDTAIVRFKAGEENYWWNGTYDAVAGKDATTDPLSAYSCKVILDSTSPSEKATISYEYMIELVGDLTFRNVILSIPNQNAALILNSNSAVFEKDSVLKVQTVLLGVRNSAVQVDKDVNFTLEGEFDGVTLSLGSANDLPITYNGDINIVVDNAKANVPLLLGVRNLEKTCTFNGDINITVLKAKTFSLAKANPDSLIDMNGSFRMLVDDSVVAPYSVTATFDSFEAGGGKWYITNTASDDQFVKFTDTKGKFEFTSGKTAYIRQSEAEDHFAVTSEGSIVLPNGSYTISDAPIPFLPDASHKMLYFKLSGGIHYLSTRSVKLKPGEKYVFEYSIVCDLQEDSIPSVINFDERGFAEGGGVTSYTTTKVGDYYRVVAQVTIPEDYIQPVTVNGVKVGEKPGDTAFFGISLAPFSEGYIFDRTVYKADDATKTDLFERENHDFSKGLDCIKLDAKNSGGCWCAMWPENPPGLQVWEKGEQKLEVLVYNEETIKAFLKSLSVDDGEWWKVEDIVEEEVVVTYASAKGVFKDSTGKGISNAKMLLISDDKEYTVTTNANGEFDFGTIVTGFYELYVLDGSEKIFTGFSQYIAPDDVVNFNVISDISNLVPDYEVVEDGEEEELEEIVPSGNLSGTVYTPYLETVADLKLYLEGIGEVTTDENGNFAFADVPVGKYKLYTILEDESEYVFRDVEINENVDLKVKLKYDPPKPSITEEVNNGWIIWVIVASVVALVVVAGLIFFLVIKKKKA